MQGDEDKTLTALLDGVDHAALGDTVSISDILDEFGNRAVTPFILLIAVLLVSPLSGIPGVPTVSAVVMITLSLQALFGRRHLWLPQRLLRLTLPAGHVRRAVGWLRRPCAFVDRHSRARLRILTKGPMRWVTLLVCVLIPMSWPMLELLPFFTSFGAATIALLAFGLFTRDGIYVLAGYVLVGGSLTTAIVLFG